MLTGLTPTYDGNGWYASANFFPGFAPESVLDVEVVCARPEQLSSVDTLATTVSSNTQGYLDYRQCPRHDQPAL